MGLLQEGQEHYTAQQYWAAARGYETATTQAERAGHVEVLIKISLSEQEPLASTVRKHMAKRYGLVIEKSGELMAAEGRG
jgi:hypothetical protein